MKKLFSIIVLAGFTTAFVACGPSAEDKAKQEAEAKRITDSINKRIEDSISNVLSMAIDTTAKADTTKATTETK